MSYCLKSDIYGAVGETHAKRMATDISTDTDILKEARIDEAINRAGDRIDIFLRSRYSLPLINIPDVLKDYCVQISIYYLASRKGIDTNTKERTIKDNYDTSLKELQKVAGGSLDIGIISDTGASSPQTIPIASSPDSVFDAGDY